MALQEPITPVTSSDDLTLVRGIGETIAARLKEAGVGSFERLARTPPNELAALLRGTVRRSPERIAAESWTSQAAALAADSTSHGEGGAELEAQRARHSFTLTLLIDVRSREVLAFKLIDGQTNDSVTIPGWDLDALVAYIRERAGLAENILANGPRTVRAPHGATSPVTATAAVQQARGAGYPVARGMKLLPRIQPGVAPRAVRVRVDAGCLRVALPEQSYAVFEFHALRQPVGTTVLSRITVDLRPQEVVEIDMPIHVAQSNEPVDRRVVLWVIAPGPRPTSLAAAIPSLEVDAELLFS